MSKEKIIYKNVKKIIYPLGVTGMLLVFSSSSALVSAQDLEEVGGITESGFVDTEIVEENIENFDEESGTIIIGGEELSYVKEDGYIYTTDIGESSIVEAPTQYYNTTTYKLPVRYTIYDEFTGQIFMTFIGNDNYYTRRIADIGTPYYIYSWTGIDTSLVKQVGPSYTLTNLGWTKTNTSVYKGVSKFTMKFTLKTTKTGTNVENFTARLNRNYNV